MTNRLVDAGVAASAVTSPWWVQLFEGANTILATVLTILGIFLTLLKIVQQIDRNRAKKLDDQD